MMEQLADKRIQREQDAAESVVTSSDSGSENADYDEDDEEE